MISNLLRKIKTPKDRDERILIYTASHQIDQLVIELSKSVLLDVELLKYQTYFVVLATYYIVIEILKQETRKQYSNFQFDYEAARKHKIMKIFEKGMQAILELFVGKEAMSHVKSLGHYIYHR